MLLLLMLLAPAPEPLGPAIRSVGPGGTESITLRWTHTHAGYVSWPNLDRFRERLRRRSLVGAEVVLDPDQDGNGVLVSGTKAQSQEVQEIIEQMQAAKETER